MALNLSNLTSPSTSDNVLSDIYTTADQGDGIALMDDLSPNSIDATQTTANHQPIAYDAANGGPFARFDGSDDRMSFTLASPITNGTVFFATQKGSYAANLDLAAGTHDFSGNKIADYYLFANDLVALYLFDYDLTQSQINQLTAYFVTKGAVENYGAETSLLYAWRDCSSLTSFPLIDVSSVNNFFGAWGGCSGLTSFPLIDTSSGTTFRFAWGDCSSLTNFPLIDTSSGTNFRYAWIFCTSLQDFPAGFFNNWNPSSIISGVFDGTWYGCSSLTSQSVENILTSIDASGKYATDTGASGGTALADAGIDIDYNGDPLSAATTAAIDSLSDKGWQVYINGEQIIPNILTLQPAAAYSLRSFDADADPNVVNVRRSSDNATSDFTASEVSDGTLTSWVNTEYNLYTSDFSSGVDGWIPYGTTISNASDPVDSTNDVLKIISNSSGSVRAVHNSVLTVGQSYEITAQIYIPSSNSEVNGVLILDGYNVSGIFGDGEALPTDQWVTVTGSGVSEEGSFRIQLDSTDDDINGTLTNNSIGDIVYVKNVQVTQTTADGHVTTWYDQSGTNHATQSTASSQPKIVDAGTLVTEGGLAALDFDGTDDYLAKIGTFSINGEHMILAVHANEIAGGYMFSLGYNDFNSVLLWSNSTNYSRYWLSGSVDQLNSGENVAGQRLTMGEFVSGTQTLYINGTQNSTKSTDYSGGDVPDITIGYAVERAQGSNYLDGKVQELIFFNADQSANRTGIENNINDHFDIYS